jgi:hypothetical protein
LQVLNVEMDVESFHESSFSSDRWWPKRRDKPQRLGSSFR